MIPGCTAYDFILVHTTKTTTNTTTTTTTTDMAVPVQPTTTTKNETSSSTKLPSTAPTTTSSIGASECIFRFGTQYSSSSNRSNDDRITAVDKESANMKVYLVVHHSRTGDILQFPISAYNTIQQDPAFTAVNEVVSPTTTNQSSYERPLQDRDETQRSHDPIALQHLMEALTGGGGDSSDSAIHTTPVPTVPHHPRGPYKANFILMSSTTTNNNKNNNDDDDDNTKDNDLTAPKSPKPETLLGIAPFRIFIYPSHHTQLGILDLDGTITTSTLTGFWNTAVLHDYSIRLCHAGVCQFLNHLVRINTSTNTNTTNHNAATAPSTTTSSSPIQLIYLTNRPIAFVDTTRNLLKELQEDTYTLPEGPLIGFTGSLAGVFKMDFYDDNAHEFKYNTLEKYVLQPFIDVGATSQQIFYAGFGNTVYDMHAYHRVGIEAHRMFIIDKQSRIYACDASAVKTASSQRNEHDEDTKQTAAVSTLLDHPRQYKSLQGTMFAAGYLDPNLMTYIANLE